MPNLCDDDGYDDDDDDDECDADDGEGDDDDDDEMKTVCPRNRGRYLQANTASCLVEVQDKHRAACISDTG